MPTTTTAATTPTSATTMTATMPSGTTGTTTTSPTARGLREDLGAAEERIRELEDGTARTRFEQHPGGV